MSSPILMGPAFLTDSTHRTDVAIATEIRSRAGVRPCPAAPLAESAVRRRGPLVTSGAVVLHGADTAPAITRAPDRTLEWGTPASPSLMDMPVAALGGLGPVTVEQPVTTEENTHFTLPAIGGTR
jgi:hypothetical protein